MMYICIIINMKQPKQIIKEEKIGFTFYLFCILAKL